MFAVGLDTILSYTVQWHFLSLHESTLLDSNNIKMLSDFLKFPYCPQLRVDPKSCGLRYGAISSQVSYSSGTLCYGICPCTEPNPIPNYESPQSHKITYISVLL